MNYAFSSSLFYYIMTDLDDIIDDQIAISITF